MSQKRSAAHPADSVTPGGKDLAAAVQALTQAAQALKSTAAQMTEMMRVQGGGEPPTQVAEGDSAPAPDSTGEGPPPQAPRAPGPDDEARLFYERLEQTGQLVNWDESKDLADLPSRVTHIRRPDGTIERIGFSSA